MEGDFVHEYRRFVQAELDARGWKPTELARRAGLHRQLVWKILHDERSTLGQMPEESTMEGISRGFGIPVDRVRIAAARSLRGYEDDGVPLSNDLRDVSIDVLLTEIRRRVEDVQSGRPRRLSVDSVTEDQGKKFPYHRRGAVDVSADEPAIEDWHENRQ